MLEFDSSFVVNGRQITVILSHRAKTRISLSVLSNSEVRLSVPPHISLQQAWCFLLDKQDWLAEHLSVVNKNPTINPSEVLFLGEKIPLVYVDEENKCCAKIVGKQMQVFGVCDNKNRHFYIANCLMEHARILLAQRLESKAQQLKLSYNGFVLGKAKRSWGSCNSAGIIRLNWRLIQAPEAVIDYVIVHELTHLCHMNHSAQFWMQLAAWHPNWRTDKSWLRENSMQLIDWKGI